MSTSRVYMKKNYGFIVLFLIAGATGGATEFSPTGSNFSDEYVTATTVAKIRIQEISRVLTELKVQEIALKSEGKDQSKLGVVLAQEAELERELLRVTIWALEDEDRMLAQRYLSEHPKRKALRDEIEARKADLAKRT
jgi:hypothetical protein